MPRNVIDIGSKSPYPANVLSNFYPHKFVFDGVACASMEGLLQSFKSEVLDQQIYLCSLVGYQAKKAGRNLSWQSTQTLWWKGVAYRRQSEDYRRLCVMAYTALMAQSHDFRLALIDTGDADLLHSIGRTDPKQTILTAQEFCSLLTGLRGVLNDPVAMEATRRTLGMDGPVAPSYSSGRHADILIIDDIVEDV